MTTSDQSEERSSSAEDLPDEPSSAAAPRRGPALILAVSLAVVLGIAAVVLAVLLAAQGDEDEHTDLRSRAGRFAEALVTYDYRDPEAHRDEILSMATGAFADQYEGAFDQGLEALITEVEASSAGFVKDIYLSEVDAGQAQAVVVVDIENDGKAGPNRLFDIYFRLTLIELDGEWLVDDVTDLNFGQAGGGTPTAPSSTTTTTTGTPTDSVP